LSTAPELSALTREAEHLLRTIAPCELRDKSCYLVFESELPPELRAANGGGAGACRAYTAPTLDLCIKDALGPRWAGRGFAAVLADDVLVPAGQRREAVLATGLHELAHALARRWSYGVHRATADPVHAAFLRLFLAEALDAEQADPPEELPPWTGHGRRFVRALCHLLARAQRSHLVGVDGVFVSLACPAWYYRPFGPGSFLLALAEELTGPSDRPLAEVLGSKPPAEFNWLWQDIRASHNDLCEELRQARLAQHGDGPPAASSPTTTGEPCPP
jgi:hypothetical protein